MVSETLILEATRARFSDRAWSSVGEIPGGGSDRRYFRVTGDDAASWIVMHYTDARADNAKFEPATETLRRIGVAVPEIHGGLAYEDGTGLLWMDDLGDATLLSRKAEPWERDLAPLYRATLEAVAPLHRCGVEDLEEDERSLLEPPFDDALYQWEQDYFFDHFVGQLLDGKGANLRDDPSLQEIVSRLADEPRRLVHRDFQSQNVMVTSAESVVLIDYQGLRSGLPEYDLASLLWDPYVGLSASQRDQMITFHWSLLGMNGDADDQRRLRLCTGQRLMQALGAYANLSINLGKPEFREHVAPAFAALQELADEEPLLACLRKLDL